MPEDERSLQERIAAAKSAKQKQDKPNFQVTIQNNSFDEIPRGRVEKNAPRQANVRPYVERTPNADATPRTDATPHTDLTPPTEYGTMEYWQPIYQDAQDTQKPQNSPNRNANAAHQNTSAEGRQERPQATRPQPQSRRSGQSPDRRAPVKKQGQSGTRHTPPTKKSGATTAKTAPPNRAKNNPKGKQNMKAYQPYEEETVSRDGSGKPRKKRHIFRKLFVLLLVLCIGVFGAYSYFSLKMIDQMNLVETGARTDFSGTTLMESDKVRNILLIGSDTRFEEENGRSDTMILISLNKETDTMTMTSFMRDMYVNIPGYGMDKMNAALVYGGPELVMDTVAENFNVRVDEYVYVDFYSFVDIVDAMGGIEIKISEDEAIGMQAPMAEQNKILEKSYGSDYLSEGGTFLMNGNQALGYARLRYVGNADFDRTQRQRLVIQKIIEKFKTLGLAEKKSAAEAVFSHLTTNMDKKELYLLSLRAPFLLGYDVNELRIPVDDGWTYGTAGTSSILDVDFEMNTQALREEIYE